MVSGHVADEEARPREPIEVDNFPVPVDIGRPAGGGSYEKLDYELLVRAFRFTDRAHAGQVRISGEPYVTHVIEVARILADLQLDSATVASALLHDVVEDTDITIADVERVDADAKGFARGWEAYEVPEVSGVDTGGPLDDEVIAWIRQALLDHKVVFFREQKAA